MIPSTNPLSLDYARRLDATDELARFRQEFVIADPELIYLDGNSLGRLSKGTAERLSRLVQDEWGCELIRGWNLSWYDAPQRTGEKLARLVGAAPGQVIVSDSTSVNLFKLVMAALQQRPGRTKIISDCLNFPSDLYILQSCIHLLGDRHQLMLVSSPDGISPDLDELHTSLDDDTALLCLSHVVFKSGFLYDAVTLTARAQQVGALTLWDVCHSVGALPVELDAWGADLAVGCTYKYLNGGPGAPAFLYVRHDLQELMRSPIWGWFGQTSPFDFALDYIPADGIKRFLVSSPPILSLLAMEASLDLILQADIAAMRRKSLAQTAYLIDLFDSYLAPLGFSLGSPRQPEARGSHISLRHPDGYRINRALIEDMQVIPDFRQPDNIRLGLAPLYTTYGEIWEAVQRLRHVVQAGLYIKYSQEQLPVT